MVIATLAAATAVAVLIFAVVSINEELGRNALRQHEENVAGFGILAVDMEINRGFSTRVLVKRSQTSTAVTVLGDDVEDMSRLGSVLTRDPRPRPPAGNPCPGQNADRGRLFLKMASMRPVAAYQRAPALNRRYRGHGTPTFVRPGIDLR